ncbi:MAG: GIY-YIG nuclease family protein [Bacteroidales bacterium]|nr:GIY-YIG nuclease family protein [Bacteroidales bacterium]
MASCYIIYSPKASAYYVGATTEDVSLRISRHNQDYYGVEKYTKISDDWELYIEIKCTNINQAMQIEKHIKKMKSREYYKSLKKYPEMVIKLLNKYKDLKSVPR